MQTPDRPDSLAAFSNAIAASEGFRRRARGRMLGYMIYTFTTNATELQRQLERYGNPNLAMLRSLQRQNPADERMRSEVLRVLHNFLAAAKSLVDHARNFMNEVYADDPLRAEYNTRVAIDFKAAPVVQFVHDLRNYMLHKSIPILFEQLWMRSGEQPTLTVALDTKTMRDWSGWTSGAQRFLDLHAEHTEIKTVVDEYLRIVLNFYKWLADRRDEADKEHMEELRHLQDELRQYSQRFRDELA